MSVPVSAEVAEADFRRWALEDGGQMRAWLEAARRSDPAICARQERYEYRGGFVFEVRYSTDEGLEAWVSRPDDPEAEEREIRLGAKPVRPPLPKVDR